VPARLLWVAAGALALAAWAWLVAEAGQTAPAATRSVAAAASRSESATAAMPAVERSAPPSLSAPSLPARSAPSLPSLSAPPAGSLAGTDVDGAWQRDARGHFVPTADALRRFDYFLSVAGEHDAAAIRGLVQASAQQELTAVDAAAALALYDRYLAYRSALHAAFAGAAPSRDAAAALALIEDTQRELFGRDEAARLFGADNALVEVSIARRDLMARTELDPDERAAGLAALEQRLPERVRAARADQRALAAAVAGVLAAR
jgi:lipase chaperone LimK